MRIFQELSIIKNVLAGDSIIDISYEQGVGRLDREPVLIPDSPDKSQVQHPQFLMDDGLQWRPTDSDRLEQFTNL
jgi:hypothetical protein